ncbi:MAG: hypothetical protein IIB44_07295 [Candidatus Marinimicrobia bacterium]|nr:hypothetical protein [Candidatus Neomarinimicrobiota bacterium]MCH8068755.1 hypothetical protein [Candidatus Neomarinimicrobiota bacterium]
MRNLSRILPELLFSTRKAVLRKVIAGITIFEDTVEMGIGERIYSLGINEKTSANHAWDH